VRYKRNKKIRLKYSTIGQVFRAIETWLEVRGESEYGKRKPIEAYNFLVEADHSYRGGLLGYIMDGKEPHEFPPPRYYSRPWHNLIDAGPEGIKGCFDAWIDTHMMGSGEKPIAVIGQHQWEVVKRLGDGDWLLTYPNLGQWRLTLLKKAESRHQLSEWHLRPYKEEDNG